MSSVLGLMFRIHGLSLRCRVSELGPKVSGLRHSLGFRAAYKLRLRFDHHFTG